jgi:hypothetical protein
VKTTIDIPEPLYKKAKILAVERGQTLKQVVLTSLQKELAETPEVAERRTPYFAHRKLVPEFKRLSEAGLMKMSPGARTIDDIVSDIKADPNI